MSPDVDSSSTFSSVSMLFIVSHQGLALALRPLRADWETTTDVKVKIILRPQKVILAEKKPLFHRTDTYERCAKHIFPDPSLSHVLSFQTNSISISRNGNQEVFFSSTYVDSQIFPADLKGPHWHSEKTNRNLMPAHWVRPKLYGEEQYGHVWDLGQILPRSSSLPGVHVCLCEGVN